MLFFNDSEAYLIDIPFFSIAYDTIYKFYYKLSEAYYNANPFYNTACSTIK
jgi:hypothetical protein